MQDRAWMRQLVGRQSAPASSSTSAQGPSHFGRVTDHFSERISSGIPTAHQQKRAPGWGPFFCGVVFGGVLLSHTLAGAVPSALEGLASGFGMGPGVSPPLWPP
jgi:hypothetical protein